MKRKEIDSTQWAKATRMGSIPPAGRTTKRKKTGGWWGKEKCNKEVKLFKWKVHCVNDSFESCNKWIFKVCFLISWSYKEDKWVCSFWFLQMQHNTIHMLICTEVIFQSWWHISKVLWNLISSLRQWWSLASENQTYCNTGASKSRLFSRKLVQSAHVQESHQSASTSCIS